MLKMFTDISLYCHIPIATPLCVTKQYAPPANAEILHTCHNGLLYHIIKSSANNNDNEYFRGYSEINAVPNLNTLGIRVITQFNHIMVFLNEEVVFAKQK